MCLCLIKMAMSQSRSIKNFLLLMRKMKSFTLLKLHSLVKDFNWHSMSATLKPNLSLRFSRITHKGEALSSDITTWMSTLPHLKCLEMVLMGMEHRQTLEDSSSTIYLRPNSASISNKVNTVPRDNPAISLMVIMNCAKKKT